jgi:hypothetical protein
MSRGLGSEVTRSPKSATPNTARPGARHSSCRRPSSSSSGSRREVPPRTTRLCEPLRVVLAAPRPPVANTSSGPHPRRRAEIRPSPARDSRPPGQTRRRLIRSGHSRAIGSSPERSSAAHMSEGERDRRGFAAGAPSSSPRLVEIGQGHSHRARIGARFSSGRVLKLRQDGERSAGWHLSDWLKVVACAEQALADAFAPTPERDARPDLLQLRRGLCTAT